MESDMLIRHEEVGSKGEYDVSKRWREILFWDIMDPNEVVLEPNEALLKRPAVEGSGKRQPVGHKRHRKCTRSNRASTCKELEQECKLHDPNIDGLSKDRKDPDHQAGGRKQRAAGFLFPKMQRFSLSHKTRRKNSKEEKKGYFLISSTVANNEPGEGGNETNLETGATKNFWRDPYAKFCCICGDGEQHHVELTCPYNYLSPASYTPCKARLLFWQNETTDTRRFGRPKQGPILDELTRRRIGFLRCFVRVNNLPKQCCLEKLVGLFIRFGPLRGWYVSVDSSGTCSGFGYMIFQHRAHAEEAIDILNCDAFGDCKLRVDWAYPCA